MTTESRYDKFFEILEAHSTLIDLRKDREIKLTEIERPIVWRDLFGNENPVEIEVGCGKGRFLLEVAKRHPEINYLGIEKARKYADRTKERLMKHLVKRRNLTGNPDDLSHLNVWLVWSDASYFVDRYVTDNSVNAYHVYFPHPWPKKRHRKRRLFRNEIWLRAMIRTLKPNGGRLYLATDYTEYFYEIYDKLTQSTPLVYVSPNPTEIKHIPTNFEMKYQEEGRKIYRAVYEMQI